MIIRPKFYQKMSQFQVDIIQRIRNKLEGSTPAKRLYFSKIPHYD